MAFIPAHPEHFDDGIAGLAPTMWYGPDAPDGTATEFASAGVGSLYFHRDQDDTEVTVYIKVANDVHADDWAQFYPIVVPEHTHD